MNSGRSRVIAVTGGIGSGKSVVCRVLSAIGHEVYDCDSQAKRLMDESPEIKAALQRRIHPDVVTDGIIDRRLLSSIVFNDSDKLAMLNSIVHAAVRSDIAHWIDSHEGEGMLFIETAILYQSGLDKMVDEVWEVTAPDSVRIERVMRRNGLAESEVRARIDSQAFEPAEPHKVVRAIVNDGCQSLLEQIHSLVGSTVSSSISFSI